MPLGYPTRSDNFEWIHPHFDVASDFLEILPGFIYTAVDGSEKGKAVIHACGLDKSEELRARELDQITFSHQTLTNSMLVAVLTGTNITNHDIAVKLDEKYPGMGVDSMETWVAILRGVSSEPEALATALLDVSKQVTRAQQVARDALSQRQPSVASTA
jgi:hypothetical protein